MRCTPLLVALAASTTCAAICPTISTRDNENSGFVTRQGTRFFLDGKPFYYSGTNAYWLHQLSNDSDIDLTLNEMASFNVTVVRTWAFNDVEEKPQVGPYFQLWKDGKPYINTGPDGLQRLDKVVQAAERTGVKLVLALTNNWNPGPEVRGRLTKRNNFPRGFLSNSYGGMDIYVRNLANPNDQFHDKFYEDEKIIQAFKDYVNVVVSRYANCKSVLGWELANDPRCSSTLPACDDCNTQKITKWTHEISSYIKSIDSNHLVSTGDGGFYCADCPKLFPLSSHHQKDRREPLTVKEVLETRSAFQKRQSEEALREMRRRGEFGSGLRIRSNWIEPRQSNAVGQNFDGSFGVDTEDLLNVPGIDFGSFQFLPDQNAYGVDNPNLPKLTNQINQGNEWINQQAKTAATYDKPKTASALGIVSQTGDDAFVPFNAIGVQPVNGNAPDTTQLTSAYIQLSTTAYQKGVTGINIYQWGQTNLTPEAGSPFFLPDDTAGLTKRQGTKVVSPQEGTTEYGANVKAVYQVTYGNSQSAFNIGSGY